MPVSPVPNLDAGGRAVVGEDDVVLRVRLGQVRQLPVLRRRDLGHVAELELLDSVVVPALAEGLPVADVLYMQCIYAMYI